MIASVFLLQVRGRNGKNDRCGIRCFFLLGFQKTLYYTAFEMSSICVFVQSNYTLKGVAS